MPSNARNITFNLEDTIRDLDSVTTTDSVSTDILLNVMSGLYRLDADTRPVPDLAKDVKISEDQLTYTFTLRDGIKWSNGDPVTANDFEYAWKQGLKSRHGRPVRLHHHHLRQGRRRLQHRQGQR